MATHNDGRRFHFEPGLLDNIAISLRHCLQSEPQRSNKQHNELHLRLREAIRRLRADGFHS
jgi:hypothetical protein